MGARPIIIDCDPGQDDAVALLLAFASPEIEVVAVTTVAGNVPLELTASNARRICELAGRADVAVYAGCPRPILGRLETAERVHGATGLAGADLPEPAMPLAPGHAVAFLIERLMASDGDVTVAAMGPLTNLALAVVEEPRIVPRMREIVLMGGSMGPGNASAAAEFNIHTDPHAAAVVFSAGAPLTMIGLDVTHKAVATPERVTAISALRRPAAAVVAAMLETHLARAAAHPGARAAKRPGGRGTALHDPCVIAYLLRPELFEARPMHVAIETANPLTLGQTVVDRDGVSGVSGEAPNANVVVEIDADGFFALLTERLGRL